jgi:hypothetical protein
MNEKGARVDAIYHSRGNLRVDILPILINWYHWIPVGRDHVLERVFEFSRDQERVVRKRRGSQVFFHEAIGRVPKARVGI